MSTHESVVAAIQTQLADYAGTYPPEAVQRLVYFPEEWMPDSTFETVYVLYPGDETIIPGSSCTREGRAEVVVAGMRRHYQPTESEVRWQIANTVADDITAAIFSDHTFGGEALSLVDQSLFIDRTQSARHEAYAIVWVRFVVRYVQAA